LRRDAPPSPRRIRPAAGAAPPPRAGWQIAERDRPAALFECALGPGPDETGRVAVGAAPDRAGERAPGLGRRGPDPRGRWEGLSDRSGHRPIARRAVRPAVRSRTPGDLAGAGAIGSRHDR